MRNSKRGWILPILLALAALALIGTALWGFDRVRLMLPGMQGLPLDAAIRSTFEGIEHFVLLKRIPLLVLGVECALAAVVLALLHARVMRIPESIARSKLTWAVIAEFLILMVCLFLRPDFFAIDYQPQNGVLYGTLIDILNRSAEITIIAMGMTLVIATGGTDLSVGASVAVAGALALKLMRWDMAAYPTPSNWTYTPFALVVVAALAACVLMGMFNGVLVSRLKIQPFIATLILMVAGRGIAQVITNGKQMTTLYSPFKFLSQGSLLFVPAPVIIMAVVVLAVSLFTRRTAFGLFVESVGINPSASRVSGINSRRVLMLVYTLTALLAGISGLIYSSRIMSNDSNNAGLNYELDAILAVVIGGTSMSGGKYSLAGTVVGSIIIRTIISFVLYFEIAAEATMAFKAAIVAVVIILQSEPVRMWFARRSARRANLRKGGAVHA